MNYKNQEVTRDKFFCKRLALHVRKNQAYYLADIFCNNAKLMKGGDRISCNEQQRFDGDFAERMHNFQKCAGLLVAQITSLTEGYLLLSEDPVQGGKMEWSQEEEGEGRTTLEKKDHVRRGVGLWPGVTTPYCLSEDSLLRSKAVQVTNRRTS